MAFMAFDVGKSNIKGNKKKSLVSHYHSFEKYKDNFLSNSLHFTFTKGTAARV